MCILLPPTTSSINSISLPLPGWECECQLWIINYSSLLYAPENRKCCSVSPRSGSASFSALTLFFPYMHTCMLDRGDSWRQRVSPPPAKCLPACQPLHHCSTHLLHSPLMDRADGAPAPDCTALNCLTFTQRSRAVRFRDSVGSLRLCLCPSTFRESKEDFFIDTDREHIAIHQAILSHLSASFQCCVALKCWAHSCGYSPELYCGHHQPAWISLPT